MFQMGLSLDACAFMHCGWELGSTTVEQTRFADRSETSPSRYVWDILKWLCDVPATPDDATAEEARSLVARDVNLGRARCAATPHAKARARALCAARGDVP